MDRNALESALAEIPGIKVREVGPERGIPVGVVLQGIKFVVDLVAPGVPQIADTLLEQRKLKLGGAVGLSVLASFQATRFAALDPSPNAACLSQSPPLPQCASFLGSVEGSLISSYDQTIVVMLGPLVVAFVFVLLLKGLLPKAPPQGAADPEAGQAASQSGGPDLPMPAASRGLGVHRDVRDQRDGGAGTQTCRGECKFRSPVSSFTPSVS